jgi:hypothetical protein
MPGPRPILLIVATGVALIFLPVSIVALHIGDRINLGDGIIARMIEASIVRPRDRFFQKAQPDLYAGQRDISGRIASPCPERGARTAVFLALGQSNATNIGARRHRGRPGVVNFNFFDGRCYEAVDPLLGSTGDGGTIWTALANRLVINGRFDKILIVPIAVGGSSINRWSDPQDLGIRISAAGAALKSAGITVTQVFFLQGEADHHPEGNWARIRPSEFVRIGVKGDRYSMRGKAYEDHFFKVRSHLQATGIAAPVSIAVKTRCGDKDAEMEGPVSKAQRRIARYDEYVEAGPDINALENDAYSVDLCHLSDSGIEEVAKIWARLLHGSE